MAKSDKELKTWQAHKNNIWSGLAKNIAKHYRLENDTRNLAGMLHIAAVNEKSYREKKKEEKHEHLHRNIIQK